MASVEDPGSIRHRETLLKMQQPETAKNILVYLNGDKFFSGRKVVVNRRHIADFDGFLNQVTMRVKAPFGAVRNIYTPQAGHRVSDLEQLQSGMKVVAGGVERFRKLEYQEIGLKKRQPKRNYLDIKFHSRMNVSARWRKYIKEPCQIYVYGNGDMNAPALRLLIIPRLMKSWDLVLEEITEKLSVRTGQAVRKLYDMDYRLLIDPSQLENGHYYVAVGTERLKKYPYGEIQQKHLSPRRHTQPLPPIKRTTRSKFSTKEEGDQTYMKMFAQKKQREEEETTVMGASAATGYRPLKIKQQKPQRPSVPPTHEAESVFHAKPVKVKRSSGRVVSVPHPPTQEYDGVFKTNSDTIRAEEVVEDVNMKVDLPIDQIPADEIEEETAPAEPSNPDENHPVEAASPSQRNDLLIHDEHQTASPISSATHHSESVAFVPPPDETENVKDEDAVEEVSGVPDPTVEAPPDTPLPDNSEIQQLPAEEEYSDEKNEEVEEEAKDEKEDDEEEEEEKEEENETAANEVEEKASEVESSPEFKQDVLADEETPEVQESASIKENLDGEESTENVDINGNLTSGNKSPAENDEDAPQGDASEENVNMGENTESTEETEEKIIKENDGEVDNIVEDSNEPRDNDATTENEGNAESNVHVLEPSDINQTNEQDNGDQPLTPSSPNSRGSHEAETRPDVDAMAMEEGMVPATPSSTNNLPNGSATAVLSSVQP